MSLRAVNKRDSRPAPRPNYSLNWPGRFLNSDNQDRFIRSIDRAGELVWRLEKLRDTAPLKAVRSGT
jgi:hypothetical protein